VKKISILCPTRERANRAYNYSRSILNTSDTLSRVEILFYVDNDDPSIESYKRLFPKDTVLLKVIYGPPMSVSKSWNVLASHCTGDILFMGNDDLLHETQGWDSILEKTSEEYLDDIYCIFFDDGINHGKHCAFPAVSRKWYDTLGYFSPGVFEFLYNDTWVFDIAKRIGRVRYVPEVMVRHNHWTVEKVKDATTKRHRDDNPGRARRDKAKYERTVNDREMAAEKLRAIMKF
jgi:glycosyltransferase involved in cell wall biosynthesis